MKFTEALKHMKAGGKVKLPSWGGYWYWDDGKETIMIHTRDGKELDIRETQVVEYTTLNICSDEWLIADKDNCPELGGEAMFNFGDRFCWNIRCSAWMAGITGRYVSR